MIINTHSPHRTLQQSNKKLSGRFSTCSDWRSVCCVLVTRRHPDVSPCRHRALKISLNRRTSSLAAQRKCSSHCRTVTVVIICDMSGLCTLHVTLSALYVIGSPFRSTSFCVCCPVMIPKVKMWLFSAAWIKWRACWLCRGKCWLRLWVYDILTRLLKTLL